MLPTDKPRALFSIREPTYNDCFGYCRGFSHPAIQSKMLECVREMIMASRSGICRPVIDSHFIGVVPCVYNLLPPIGRAWPYQRNGAPLVENDA